MGGEVATREELAQVSRLLSEVKLLLRHCGEEEARLSDGGEAEAAVLPDDLRGLYREAVAQLLELVPDYDELFGLDPPHPPVATAWNGGAQSSIGQAGAAPCCGLSSRFFNGLAEGR